MSTKWTCRDGYRQAHIQRISKSPLFLQSRFNHGSDSTASHSGWNEQTLRRGECGVLLAFNTTMRVVGGRHLWDEGEDIRISLVLKMNFSKRLEKPVSIQYTQYALVQEIRTNRWGKLEISHVTSLRASMFHHLKSPLRSILLVNLFHVLRGISFYNPKKYKFSWRYCERGRRDDRTCVKIELPC